MSAVTLASSQDLYPRMSDWVRFESGEMVTVLNGKVEIGQGIGIAITQIAAEELELPVERVQLISGDTRHCPNEWWTSASISIEVGGGLVRKVCGAVREEFTRAAARRLHVSPEAVTLQAGRFRADRTDDSVTYWDLVAEVDLSQGFKDFTAVKPYRDYKVVGTAVQRNDLPRKLSGGAFIHDFVLPNMLHGRILRPPSYGSRLESLDRDRFLTAAPDAQLVVNGSFVGVCTEREEVALKAVEAARNLSVWSPSDSLPPDGPVRDWLSKLPIESSEIGSKSGKKTDTARVLSANYSKPYLAHAAIGTACAIAQYINGQLTVWSHTQGNFILRSQLALALGIGEERVDVIHSDGAGCYGHNGADDVALDAALLAMATGRPVKVVWSREDELIWSPFGPAMAMDLRATFTSDGRIESWSHEVYSTPHLTRPGWGGSVGLLAAWHIEESWQQPEFKNPPLALGGGGDRNAIPLYDFDAQSVVHHFVKAAPIRVSALRALGAYGNVFAIESFIDEIAHEVGVNPIDLRLSHLRDARAKDVVLAAQAAANRSPAPPDDGAVRGRGFGFARYKNTGAYFALVVQVCVEESIRVEHVWAAVDAGLVVNPDGLVNQIEGGIVQAISWTLFEEVRWDDQQILARSWDDYPILRFKDVPSIEVVTMDRIYQPSLGVGECAAGPTAAAIGNALFAALGVRVRDLPMTPERIERCL